MNPENFTYATFHAKGFAFNKDINLECVTFSQSTEREYFNTSLSEAKKSSNKFTLVIPSAFASHFRLTPKDIDGQESYLVDHIPFYIEDRLIQPIEDLEIKWIKRNHYIDVFIVDKDLITEIYNEFSEFILDIICEQDILCSTGTPNTLITSGNTEWYIDENGQTLHSPDGLSELLTKREGIYPQLVNIKESAVSQIACCFYFLNNPIENSTASLIPTAVIKEESKNNLHIRLTSIINTLCICLLLSTAYFFISSKYYQKNTDTLNRLSKSIFYEKFNQHQDFDNVSKLAKKQIRTGKKVTSFTFDGHLSAINAAWSEISHDMATIQQIKFSQNSGLILTTDARNSETVNTLIDALGKTHELEVNSILKRESSTRLIITLSDEKI